MIIIIITTPVQLPTPASQPEWTVVWRKQCGQPGTEAGGGDSGRVAAPLSTPHTHLHPV